MLLKLVEDGSKQHGVTPVALASAISFKNFVKQHWHIVSRFSICCKPPTDRQVNAYIVQPLAVECQAVNV